MLTLTLLDALEGLQNGTFTSELLTAAYLAQIAKYESTYNAFTFFNDFALSQVFTSACACERKLETLQALSMVDVLAWPGVAFNVNVMQYAVVCNVHDVYYSSTQHAADTSRQTRQHHRSDTVPWLAGAHI